MHRHDRFSSRNLAWTHLVSLPQNVVPMRSPLLPLTLTNPRCKKSSCVSTKLFGKLQIITVSILPTVSTTLSSHHLLKESTMLEFLVSLSNCSLSLGEC